MAIENSNAGPRQHARTGPETPQLPEPTYAERVRTLISLASVGTLATMSRKHPGFPFGSLMPFALDGAGRPLFLISNMAMHTQNLKADSRASLFVAQTAADGDSLGSSRATLVGEVLPVPEDDIAEARERYLARHENSRYWVDFTDFSFFRLALTELYFVGGFGMMGWVPAEDYAQAEPDPLAAAAPRILEHMNADHTPALLLLARTHAGISATGATMTGIDRLGFSLRLETPNGVKGTRINFPHAISSAGEARGVLIEMVQAAENA